MYRNKSKFKNTHNPIKPLHCTLERHEKHFHFYSYIDCEKKKSLCFFLIITKSWKNSILPRHNMGHAKPDAWEGEAKYLGRGTDSSFLSLSTLIHEPCIFMLKYVTSVMIWHQITWTYLLELCSGGKKQVFQVSGNWRLGRKLLSQLQSQVTEYFPSLPLKSYQR